jgi:hypothetical protein
MPPGVRRQHPTAREALQKSLLDEIGLDNVLNRIARLGEGAADVNFGEGI